MHEEILNGNQKELLSFLKRFKRSFYLVGGTAIALQIGHRRSIDFDLFTQGKINKLRIKAFLRELPSKQTILFEDVDQLHYLINNVKLTFFSFPFPVPHTVNFEKYVSMPDLKTLAAMKAFALGRRSKWKDYVDLYFLIKKHFTLEEISREADNIFKDQFSEKLFRQQLAYHKDIDYTEQLEYLGEPVPEKVIRAYLIDVATEIL